MTLLQAFKPLAAAGVALFLTAAPAFALYIPDKLFAGMYTDYGNMPGTTINHPNFEFISPFPTEYVLEETGLGGSSPPNGEEGGAFERNEHQIRFVTDGETSGGQATGHKFQRREAWDFAFDMKIDTPNPQIRKEAGIYFKSPVGNALFLATTNDTHYGDGPGEITTIFANVIPEYSFSGGGGPLGDYNGDGVVNAPDYTIWRDTEGSSEDFRANGSNEGASEDFIDRADYDVWAGAYGDGALGGNEIHYEAGDTLRMRLIYTPPELIDENLPDVVNDPNVMTPGTLEYIISLNGGPEHTSGPLVFENDWQGLPNDTQIAWRVQNMGTLAVQNDSSTVTYSNFDFNGDLPGTGLPSGGLIASAAGVPEPAALALLAVFGALGCPGRRRG